MDVPRDMGEPAAEQVFREDQKFVLDVIHLRCLYDVHVECLVRSQVQDRGPGWISIWESEGINGTFRRGRWDESNKKRREEERLEGWCHSSRSRRQGASR